MTSLADTSLAAYLKFLLNNRYLKGEERKVLVTAIVQTQLQLYGSSKERTSTTQITTEKDIIYSSFSLT